MSEHAKILTLARGVLAAWGFDEPDLHAAVGEDVRRAEAIISIRRGLHAIFRQDNREQARFLKTKLDALGKRSPKECMVKDDESFWRAVKLVERTVNG